MQIRNLVKNAIVFSLLVCSSSLFAQDQMQKRTPEQKATANTQWMQQNLQINADQTQKAHDIILKYAGQAETASRDQRQSIMANRDADLKGVLTAEQFQKYQAHEQQMREQMQQRRANTQQNGNQ